MYATTTTKKRDSKEVTFAPRAGLAKVGLSTEAAEAMCKQAILEGKQSRQ